MSSTEVGKAPQPLALPELKISDKADLETLLKPDGKAPAKLREGKEEVYAKIAAGKPTDIDGDGVADKRKAIKDGDRTVGVEYELSSGGKIEDRAADVNKDGKEDGNHVSIFDEKGELLHMKLNLDADGDGVDEFVAEKLKDEDGGYTTSAGKFTKDGQLGESSFSKTDKDGKPVASNHIQFSDSNGDGKFDTGKGVKESGGESTEYTIKDDDGDGKFDTGKGTKTDKEGRQFALDGKDKSGDGDFQDASEVGSRRMPNTPKAAGEVLLKHFDTLEKLGKDGKGAASGDGKVGIPELKKAAEDESLPPELREAAKFMLEHPSDFAAMEGANDRGQRDGAFSKKDLEKFVINAPDTAPKKGERTDEQAAMIVAQNMAAIEPEGMKGDGKASLEELRKASENDKLSPELRSSIKQILDSPYLSQKIDTANKGGGGDGIISVEDLIKFGTAKGPPFKDAPESPMKDMTPEQASGVIAQAYPAISGGKQTVTKEDLEKASKDEKYSPELRQALKKVLADPKALEGIDVANKGGDKDGKFSLEDFQKFASAKGNPMAGTMPKAEPKKLSEKEAARMVLQEFDKLEPGSGVGRLRFQDGKISPSELEKALENPKLSDELKGAIKVVLEKETFDAADVAHKKGKPDQVISKNDLRALIEAK